MPDDSDPTPAGTADQAEFFLLARALQQRWPEHRIDPTLDRITKLLGLLGDPQASYPVVQLTGTNGKTSTARMIDGLLSAAGLRTGRFTSPHLQSVTERICLFGEPISEPQFVAGWRDIEPYVTMLDQQLTADDQTPVSFFEVMVALAYAVFADAPVDAAVIEVGLGGRWDATNVADAGVAVITPIGVDHAHLLGRTETEIAAEKAGIIKPGAVAVIAPQLPDVLEVLLSRCAEVGAAPLVGGRDFGVTAREIAVGGQLLTIEVSGTTYPEVVVPLHGEHQAVNAAVALAAVDAFIGRNAGGITLDDDLVGEGFAGVASPGRMEVVRHSPAVILDAAHNPHGARAAAAAIDEAFALAPVIGVVGCMADKDVYGVLAAFAETFEWVVCTQNSTPRSMPAAELAEIAEEVFDPDRVLTVPRLDDAIAEGVRLAEEQADVIGAGGVLVTGSVVTVGEARTLLRPERRQS